MATRRKTKKFRKSKKSRKIGGVKSKVNEKSSSKNTNSNFKKMQTNAQSMLKSITDPERKKRLKTILSKIDKQNQTNNVSNMHSSVRKKKTKTKTKNTLNLEKEWLKHANKEYNSAEEIRQFQNRIKHGDLTHLKHFDEAMTANLKIILDFLGTAAVWNFIFDNKINLYLFKPFPRKLVNSKHDYPDAYFSGSHWNSRKANELELFDPYDKFQIYGTNQFCQTYSMMYLLDELPGKEKSVCSDWTGSEDDFKRYYYYTLCALKFIKEKVTRCANANLIVFDDSGADGNRKFYKDTLLPLIDQYIKQYRVCINVIELPERQLTN